MIRSTVVALTVKEEKTLLVAERKNLRKILGRLKGRMGAGGQGRTWRKSMSEPKIVGGTLRKNERKSCNTTNSRRPGRRLRYYRWSDEYQKDLRGIGTGD